MVSKIIDHPASRSPGTDGTAYRFQIRSIYGCALSVGRSGAKGGAGWRRRALLARFFRRATAARNRRPAVRWLLGAHNTNAGRRAALQWRRKVDNHGGGGFAVRSGTGGAVKGCCEPSMTADGGVSSAVRGRRRRVLLLTTSATEPGPPRRCSALVNRDSQLMLECLLSFLARGKRMNVRALN